MSDLVVCLSQLAGYLKVPVGQINSDSNSVLSRVHKNVTTKGFLNIIDALVSESNCKPVGEEEACLRQWLEYALVYVARSKGAQNTQQILNEMNGVLSSRTYLVTNQLMIADVVLYYLLQGVVQNMTCVEKEKYVNVSRWFDNVQVDSQVRQGNALVNFNTNYLCCLIPAQH